MLTRVEKLIAEGVKGLNFALDLRRPLLIVGANGLGKTARLLALSLVLEKRIRGSAVPSALGDEAADSGAVELQAEGRSYTSAVFKLGRTLGHKHAPRMEVGGRYEKKAEAVEALLEEHFGHQRGEPTNLSWFVGLTADKQARLVAEVTGVSLADPKVKAELDEVLATLVVEYEDARGVPRRGPVPDALRQEVAGVLKSDGIVVAGETAREKKNESQRVKLEAEKTRKRLLELMREDVPPGRLAELREELRAQNAALQQIREQQGAREAQARSRAQAQDRLRRADAELAAARPAHAAATAALQGAARPNVDALEQSGRELAAVANGTFRAHAEALSKRDAARADAERTSKTLETLRCGSCPTCRTSGQALADAVATYERLQKVAAVKVQRAEKAEGDARAAHERAQAACDANDRQLKAARAAAEKHDKLAQAEADAKARVGRAEKAAVDVRAELAGLPEVEGLEDLQVERERLEDLVGRLSADVEALAAAEENERARAQNEVDLNTAIATRAAWALLEGALSTFSRELTRRTVTPVEDAANRIVEDVYDGSDGRPRRRFQFRPEKCGESGWGFGLATVDAAGAVGGWVPFGALSDSEQMVCGAALTFAMLLLGRRPFRSMVLDRLEALETTRALRLMRALARAHAAGDLSNVLCAMRINAEDAERARSVFAEALAGTGAAVLDVGATGSSALVVYPSTDEPTDDEYVICRGRTGERQDRITAAAHRARGCDCGAEEEARRKKAAATAAVPASKAAAKAAETPVAAQAAQAAPAEPGAPAAPAAPEPTTAPAPAEPPADAEPEKPARARGGRRKTTDEPGEDAAVAAALAMAESLSGSLDEIEAALHVLQEQRFVLSRSDAEAHKDELARLDGALERLRGALTKAALTGGGAAAA